MKRTFLVAWAMAAAVVAGCERGDFGKASSGGGGSGGEGAAAEAKPKPKAAATVAEPVARHGPVVTYDRSMTPEQYIEQGVPKTDHRWTGKDYRTAVGCLRKVIANNGQPPRYASGVSGPVYLWMVGDENVKPILDTNNSPSQRVSLGVDLIQGLHDLAKLYGDQAKAGRDYDEERGDIQDTLLQAIAALHPQIDEYVTSFSEDQPNYKQQMATIERVRGLMNDMTEECLKSLGETDHFRPAAMSRMCIRFERTVPEIMLHVPEERANAWMQIVTKAQAAEKESEARDGLESLLTKMKAYKEVEAPKETPKDDTPKEDTPKEEAPKGEGGAG